MKYLFRPLPAFKKMGACTELLGSSGSDVQRRSKSDPASLHTESKGCIKVESSADIQRKKIISKVWLAWKGLVRRIPFSKNEDHADTVYKVNGL